MSDIYKIQLSHVEIQMATAVGKMRTRECSGFKSTITMTKDNDYLGACGEIAFADSMGVDWDWRNKKYGDGGIDFILNNYTIDVKCTRGDPSRRRLMVVENKVTADIYVHTAHDIEIPGLISMIGWEKKEVILQIPPEKPPNFYNYNHIIESKKLRPMQDLYHLLFSLPGNDQ